MEGLNLYFVALDECGVVDSSAWAIAPVGRHSLRLLSQPFKRRRLFSSPFATRRSDCNTAMPPCMKAGTATIRFSGHYCLLG